MKEFGDLINVIEGQLPDLMRERCGTRIGNCLLGSVKVEGVLDPDDPRDFQLGALVFCHKGCPSTSVDVEECIQAAVLTVSEEFNLDID